MARGHEPFAPPVAGLLVSRAVLRHKLRNSGMSAQRLEADILTSELVSLIEDSASTAEAAEALHSHRSLNFMSTRLQKHADLSLEQVLIDLHHSRRERLFCHQSSWYVRTNQQALLHVLHGKGQKVQILLKAPVPRTLSL